MQLPSIVLHTEAVARRCSCGIGPPPPRAAGLADAKRPTRVRHSTRACGLTESSAAVSQKQSSRRTVPKANAAGRVYSLRRSGCCKQCSVGHSGTKSQCALVQPTTRIASGGDRWLHSYGSPAAPTRAGGSPLPADGAASCRAHSFAIRFAALIRHSLRRTVALCSNCSRCAMPTESTDPLQSTLRGASAPCRCMRACRWRCRWRRRARACRTSRSG